MKIQVTLPAPVERVIGKLRAHGHEAYVVGGCVRDVCMGRMPHDWDITTSALPTETIEAMEGLPVIKTGLKHGTVTVVIDHVGYEVTTYRTDGAYSDGRHPDQVVFVPELEEDLKRRDFTINAMAYSPEEGLIDLFDGLGDLQRKQIRCVGKAQERFSEDVLRILRALRFASTFGFSIEEGTQRAVHDHVKDLGKVSVERITTEFRKMIVGKGFVPLARDYVDVLTAFLPELAPCIGFEQKSAWHDLDVWEHTLKACEAAREAGGDELVMLAMLLHDIGKPFSCQEEGQIRHFRGHAQKGAEMTDGLLRRLRFDNYSRERVVELVRYHDDIMRASKKAMRRLLSILGEEQVRRLLIVRWGDLMAHHPDRIGIAREEWQENADYLEELLAAEGPITLKTLKVDGADLSELGYAPGKQMGETLKRLLELALEGTIPNDRLVMLDLAGQWLKEGS